MDPISQAAAGATFAQSASRIESIRKAALIGALAGLAPDLDVFIRSAQDPLLVLEYHRQFTHSLFFIPFGALICAVVFYVLLAKRWQLSFARIYVFSLLGYGSHGLLDACTTYGTQLFWPFSDMRVAWNTVSVIDPLFTLPLIVCLLLALIKKSRLAYLIGFAWALFYLALGWVQGERAEAIGFQLAKQRGHSPSLLEAKPSFANILVWKVVYEFNGRFYVDAVRPGFTTPTIWEGESIAKLNIARDFAWLLGENKARYAQQLEDIKRFTHFSSGFIGVDGKVPNSLIDIRYSMLPQQIDGLWGIRLKPNAKEGSHVEYFVRRENSGKAFKQLMAMMFFDKDYSPR